MGMSEMLRAALTVMGRQPNSFDLLQAWELELKGVDPLELLLISEDGTRPLDTVLHFSEGFREKFRSDKREAIREAEMALQKAKGL